MRRISMVFALAIFTPACDEAEQDVAVKGADQLERDLHLCAEENAHGPTTCAKDVLAAYAVVHGAGSGFDFTDEIEWVEPEMPEGMSPRCFGDVKIYCWGHECCGSSSGCADFCKKMKPGMQDEEFLPPN